MLRLKIGGLLWLAPVCSSFCWLSLSQTKRSPENDFRGDQTNENVREGNRGAEVATFLFVLAWARSAEACLENPPGSKIWKYPPLVNMQETLMLGRSSLHTAVVNRCVFDTSPIGGKYGKKYKFLATGAWVESETLTAKCSCPRGVHRKLVDRFGEKAVRGRSADLVASQAYPKKLGVAIVDAWLGAPSTVSVLPSSSPSDTGVVSQSSGVLGQRRPSSSWCTPGSDDDDSPPCTRPAPPCAKRPRRWAASSSDSPAVAHPKVAHRKVATARPRQWQAADSGSS